MAVAGHHARLGTQLLAKLCRGLHFRRLNSVSFQGTTRTDPYVRVYAYCSYHGLMAAKLLAAHRPFRGDMPFHSVSGACGIERCSPRPVPFPPQPPQKISLPCSAGSQVSGRRWRIGFPRCWPPSAAQTVHAVFQHTAFTKTHASGMQSKVLTEPGSQAWAPSGRWDHVNYGMSEVIFRQRVVRSDRGRG
jgi:hypothetical protein